MQKNPNVGVVIGRFQTDSLTAGHIELLDHVESLHDEVVVILGVSQLPISKRDPLDFPTRRAMILRSYEYVTVLAVTDMNTNIEWSNAIDSAIRSAIGPGREALVYGSRDSFIPSYTGVFQTVELAPIEGVNATERREELYTMTPVYSPIWNQAVIHTSNRVYPTSYQCVDAVVWREVPLNTGSTIEVLMGQRSNEPLPRFFGGFVDPTDGSLESAVRREVAEEAGGISVDGLKYIGSCNVPDQRYRGTEHCIKTAVFAAKFQFGNPKPSDDMDGSVRWIPLHSLTFDQIMPEHEQILDFAKEHFNA